MHERLRRVRGWVQGALEASRPLPADPGVRPVLDANLAWLAAAQDCSASSDGGAARDYSLIRGWRASYPETSGYIVPTLLAYAQLDGVDTRLWHARAERMASWLASIQFASGAFQGGRIDSKPVTPVTFNTGQILFALVAASRALDPSYQVPMRAAADWLVATQHADGAWHSNASPFVKVPQAKVYDTHVAWALLEAARIVPERGYADAALANVAWALDYQAENGWFAQCCLDRNDTPLTHTLGYALRGVIEAARFTGRADLLDAARRTADGLQGALGADGYLPGRLRRDWRPAASWACLTGTAQVAACWLLLADLTGEDTYRDAAFRANAYVRRTVRLTGAQSVRGGVKGSHPISGGYGQYEYLNWAAKFLADSLLLEGRQRGLWSVGPEIAALPPAGGRVGAVAAGPAGGAAQAQAEAV